MIRNLLFKIFFFLGIIIISILFLPCLFLPQSFTLIGGKIMGHWSAICLKVFLSTKIIVKGKENMEHRRLGRTGLKVSEVCLGTMTFGTSNWGIDETNHGRYLIWQLKRGLISLILRIAMQMVDPSRFWAS